MHNKSAMGHIFGPPLQWSVVVTTALQGRHLTVAPLSEQRRWGGGGVVKQLPTELLSVRQGSSLGMRRGGFEEHIPTLITEQPLVISLWRQAKLYSLHGRMAIAHRVTASVAQVPRPRNCFRVMRVLTSDVQNWAHCCC
jgi:hypothetical protein